VIAVGSPQPTDNGRPKEIVAARTVNFVMFSVIILAMAAFSSWETYRQIVLLIEGHGVKLGEHLLLLLQAAQPFILFTVLWIGWRWRRSNARPIK
jgi:hypothetical protein